MGVRDKCVGEDQVSFRAEPRASLGVEARGETIFCKVDEDRSLRPREPRDFGDVRVELVVGGWPRRTDVSPCP